LSVIAPLEIDRSPPARSLIAERRTIAFCWTSWPTWDRVGFDAFL
jgi:hypothetical protein